MYFLKSIACLTLIYVSIANATIGSYIGPSDTKKFLTILSQALTNRNEDYALNYFGAIGYKLLGESVPPEVAKENCALIQKNYKNDGTPESIFQGLSAWSALGCSGKLQSEATIKNLKIILENEKSTIQDLRYSIESLKLLGQAASNPAKVAQIVQTKIRNDDTLHTLGQALHIAAIIGNHGKFATERVEEIVTQLDEVDGKLLQWEGGLTTTSLLLTGLINLPNSRPFTNVQGEKLGSYLLTRRTVQSAKGVVALLEAAKALTSSSVSPVSISVIGNSYVTAEQPDLRLRVSDILGKALKPVPAPIVAQSATRITDDVVVLSKQPFTAGSGPTEFVLPLRLEAGQYRLAITAGSHTWTLNVRVLGQVKVKDLNIGLGDLDGIALPRLTVLQFPEKLKSPLQADSSQRLIAKFSLSRSVHQTFLRLHSGKKEIIFIAEIDSNKQYKVEVNLLSELTYSGTFDIELILGDTVMSNPIKWDIGSIEINLGRTEPESKSGRGLKPEIKHLFRPAEKRPPQSVSLMFSILTAAPIILLLGLWLKIGLNFGNFSLSAIPFHIGFGSILLLFVCFWLKLDMFQTCGWLIPLGVFTFLTGNRTLRNIATLKKTEKKE